MILRLYQQLLIELQSSLPPTSDREETLRDFVTTPYHAERVLSFGTLLALDSFLHTLTILPIRALYRLWCRQWTGDLIQIAIISLSFRVLQGVNTSRVYHAIRGQAGITMFVLYSLVEVCDKFLGSVGHEIASCLTSRRTVGSQRRTLVYAAVNLVYTVAHSFVLMWQLVTLNLAVNSYSNALLSFMLTQQFGEIKGAVFKRFDAHSLFQLTCADITQRFQCASLLLVIVMRNCWDCICRGDRLLSWTSLNKAVGPASLLMAAIMAVDWLKIAYIVNFNNIPAKPLFASYLGMLKEDYAINDSQRGLQSLVSQQAGLPVAPLVIVCVRMFAKGGVIISSMTPLVFTLLLVAKLWLGSWLYQATENERNNALIKASSELEGIDNVTRNSRRRRRVDSKLKKAKTS